MKAMVLAAGRGERMQPLTAETPKPLLEVSGKPLLAYHLEALAAAGFKQVVINVSWLAEQIVVFCGDGSRWGLHIQFSLEAAPLETAGGICQALPLLGDAPFALINADVFSDFPLGNLRNVALSPTGAHVVLVPNPPQHQQGDFALEANTVMRGLPTERLTYAGIGVYQSRFFEGHMSGAHPLRPWLLRAIDRAVLSGERWDGAWEDVGTPQRLESLNQIRKNTQP